MDTQRSTQVRSIEFDIDLIVKLIDALRNTRDVLGIDHERKQELESEVCTLEAQTRSPKPKMGIIAESLGSIRRILEGAAGNLVASGLLNQIGSLFGT